MMYYIACMMVTIIDIIMFLPNLLALSLVVLHVLLYEWKETLREERDGDG